MHSIAYSAQQGEAKSECPNSRHNSMTIFRRWAEIYWTALIGINNVHGAGNNRVLPSSVDCGDTLAQILQPLLHTDSADLGTLVTSGLGWFNEYLRISTSWSFVTKCFLCASQPRTVHAIQPQDYAKPLTITVYSKSCQQTQSQNQTQDYSFRPRCRWILSDVAV